MFRPPGVSRIVMSPSPPPRIDEAIIHYHEERLGRLRVVTTTRRPNGQILDWVRTDSQVDGKVATPPPTDKRPRKVASATAMAATFELQSPSAERGPEGTVPILRRRFSLTDKLATATRKRKLDGRRLVAKVPGGNPDGTADPAGFWHTTLSQSGTFYGCESVLAVWDPACQNAGDHSISQFGIQNYDNLVLQSLEAGWITSVGMFGDDYLHLFTYYTTNDYQKDGNNVGGYNTEYSGWVQYDSVIYPGAVIGAVDFLGFPVYELDIKYQLYNGNWWFGVQGSWIGYYPASLFGSTPGVSLSDHAEWAGFWGEVYSALADQSKTTTSMGSGQRAEYGYPFAAYQRRSQVQSDTSGTMGNVSGSLIANDSALYDIAVKPGFDGWFFFGGSGIGSPSIIVYPFP